MDRIRRKIIKTGAAVTAAAAAPQVFAQRKQGGSGTHFYEKGNVRIAYQEAGSGFPLLLIAGGGLGSSMARLISISPFNPVEEFKGEYRCIFADLRNSNGESTGPVEVERPWDSYTDDHIGLMDHLAGCGKKRLLV